MSDPKNLGPLITRRREAMNLTKAELARRAGVSAPYLSQIESGDRAPSEAVLRQLAGALDMKNIDLLEPAGLLTYGDETLAYNMDRKIRDITDLVARYNEDEAYVLNDILTNHLSDLVRFYGSGPTNPSGPEGWDELDAADQRIVQQLIRRLGPGEANEEPEE